jgi:SAM-dependent methyltransferase
MNDSYQGYFEYLKSRSRLGLIYRNFWLYPRICAHLRGRVLDVGCGIGDFVRFRQQTTGADINPEVVKFCKMRGLDVVRMDVDRLPFSSYEFDGVLVDNVLEHIESPKALIDEVYRVLKPFGTLLIGVPGQKGYEKDPDHKVFYDKEKLVDVVSTHGFVYKKSFYTPIKSAVLSCHLSQFCLYVKFTRI